MVDVLWLLVDYYKPFVDSRYTLLSFNDSIKRSALSMWPLSNEWIKCVLFLLPLNAQTNRLGSNFLRKMTLGLNYVLGTFFFFFSGCCSLGCVFEVTVGCSLFKATIQSVNLTLQQLCFPDWKRCKTWATVNWKAKKAFYFFLQHIDT